jgi:hypothetical protein
MDLFKPRGANNPRRPTDNQQQNGSITNPPRFEPFGGLTSGAKIGAKNRMAVQKPGDGKKVI